MTDMNAMVGTILPRMEISRRLPPAMPIGARYPSTTGRAWGAALLSLVLAGCAATPTVRVAPAPLATQLPRAGLEGVMGQNAAGLVRLFGQPDADVREGTARKLQFESGICVLDAYLYPKGKEEPRVTWLDARERDGSAIDRASCVAALTRRDGGK